MEEERTWPREAVEEEGTRWRELAMVEESPWRWNRACVCAGGREAGKAGPAPSSHALPADQGPAGEVFTAKAEEKGRTTVGGRSSEARAVPSWWSGPAGGFSTGGVRDFKDCSIWFQECVLLL